MGVQFRFVFERASSVLVRFDLLNEAVLALLFLTMFDLIVLYRRAQPVPSA